MPRMSYAPGANSGQMAWSGAPFALQAFGRQPVIRSSSNMPAAALLVLAAACSHNKVSARSRGELSGLTGASVVPARWSRLDSDGKCTPAGCKACSAALGRPVNANSSG